MGVLEYDAEIEKLKTELKRLERTESEASHDLWSLELTGNLAASEFAKSLVLPTVNQAALDTLSRLSGQDIGQGFTTKLHASREAEATIKAWKQMVENPLREKPRYHARDKIEYEICTDAAALQQEEEKMDSDLLNARAVLNKFQDADVAIASYNIQAAKNGMQEIRLETIEGYSRMIGRISSSIRVAFPAEGRKLIKKYEKQYGASIKEILSQAANATAAIIDYNDRIQGVRDARKKSEKLAVLAQETIDCLVVEELAKDSLIDQIKWKFSRHGDEALVRAAAKEMKNPLLKPVVESWDKMKPLEQRCKSLKAQLEMMKGKLETLKAARDAAALGRAATRHEEILENEREMLAPAKARADEFVNEVRTGRKAGEKLLRALTDRALSI